MSLDALNEILAAAGVNQQPTAYSTAITIDHPDYNPSIVPADPDDIDPNWSSSNDWHYCRYCGTPIAFAIFKGYRDRNFKEACDGALLPTDTPDPQLLHQPPENWWRHERNEQ